MKNIMPFCPKCKCSIFVGKVKSYDVAKSRSMNAYFCSNCLTEFDEDKNIMQPLLGESEEYEPYLNIPESSPWVVEFVKAAKEENVGA